MIAISTSKPNEEVTTSITLFDDNNKPTPLAIGVAATEVAIDICIAYTAYKVIKFFNRK